LKNFPLWNVFFLSFVCAILLASCAEKPPIQKGKFSDLYVALQLLEAQYAAKPAIQKVRVDSLFEAFNVNDSLVNAEISWYSRNPEQWQFFFMDVQNKLKGMKNRYLIDHS